jgi:hypothetical protein
MLDSIAGIGNAIALMLSSPSAPHVAACMSQEREISDRPLRLLEIVRNNTRAIMVAPSTMRF